jgi:hypothetical protein
VYNHLAPGGYIELQDALWELFSDDGSTTGTALEKFYLSCNAAADAMGRNLLKARHFKDYLARAGFVDIVEHRIAVPVTPWPSDRRWRRLGQYVATVLPNAFDAYRRPMLSSGMTAEEYEGLTREIKRDSVRKDLHGYSYL